MQGTPEDIDNAIATLVEKELLNRVKSVYEDVTLTIALKKTERAQITKQFIEQLAKRLAVPEDKLKSIVENVMMRAKWIEEIEDIDEALELEER